jgi:hypothetical protein
VLEVDGGPKPACSAAADLHGSDLAALRGFVGSLAVLALTLIALLLLRRHLSVETVALA